jgi:hypothetical protein
MYAMRKILLFSVASCLGITASAQMTYNSSPSSEQHSKIDETIVDVTPVNQNSSKVSVLGQLIGNGPNAYGPLSGPWTNVWADEDLNAISFIHRSDFNSNGDNQSGSLRYDLSTDGGSTFNSNIGPVWNPTGSLPGPARYPQAVIYNPSGNTSVSGAFLAFQAPSLNGTNGSWGGLVQGSVGLNTASTSLSAIEDSSTGPNSYIIPEHFTTHGNNTFGVNFSNRDGVGYTDTLIIMKGAFNSATSNFDYTYQYIDLPLGVDADGDAVYTSANLEFQPNSQTGFIVVNAYDSTFAFGLYHPIVMKTTDGGATWSAPTAVDLNALVEVDSNKTILKILQDEFTDWTINDLTSAFEQDMTVDINGNPHILVNVCPGATSITAAGDPGTPFSVFSGINNMVDVYSTDGGTSWAARLVGTPQTFRGDFGTITCDNRPQTSRSADGSQVFFHWFDTDLNIWGGTANDYPDMWMMGVDVSSGTATGVALSSGPIDMTGTDFQNSAGKISFGNVAPQTWDNGDGTYSSHLVTQELDQNTFSDLDPTTYHYYPAVYGGSGVSIDEESLNAFSLGQNSPNPASGLTKVRMNVAKSGEYSVEVMNMIGQVVMTKDLGNLGQGPTSFEFNVSDLQSGVYFYTVRSGGLFQSKKMIID